MPSFWRGARRARLDRDPAAAVQEAAAFPYRDSVASGTSAIASVAPPDLKLRAAELGRVRAVESGSEAAPERLLPPDDRERRRRSGGTMRGAQEPGHRRDQPAGCGARRRIRSTATATSDATSGLDRAEQRGGLFAPGYRPCPTPRSRPRSGGRTCRRPGASPASSPSSSASTPTSPSRPDIGGIGYRSDSDLTRTPAGQLLIEMALLNEEIDLCQSILAQRRPNDPALPDIPVRPPPEPAPAGRLRSTHGSRRGPEGVRRRSTRASGSPAIETADRPQGRPCSWSATTCSGE